MATENTHLETEGIVNKVAASSLVLFNLEEYHDPSERVLLDIKGWLFQELILKEKEFRNYVKQHDWTHYKNKSVAITCTADAIVPTWAYMLIAIALQPYAKKQVFGTLTDLETQLYHDALSQIDWQKFKGSKVVVKGCSKVEVPIAIYTEVADRLRPLAASIMFGEPCSTVPLFKATPLNSNS